ncbi:MAG: ATP-binding cassette domain-containing protein [Kofleriaceae bacterium]
MIELVDVRLDYSQGHPRSGQALLANGHLKVTPGEIVMVVGAAGVGTSRLVAAALGEAPCARGRIAVLGHDVSKLRRSSLRLLRRKVGIVPQDLCLLEDRSAQVNVALPLEIDGIPRSVSITKSLEVLARLGMEDEASLPIDCLSIAARQRVAVARALVREPELIIADHPTMWQDAAGAELVCNALVDAATAGASVLVFGRDHALRQIADQRQWRQLALVDATLRPLTEISNIDEVLIDMESVPTPKTAPAPDAEPVPNVLPFPLSARTAGVA